MNFNDYIPNLTVSYNSSLHLMCSSRNYFRIFHIIHPFGQTVSQWSLIGSWKIYELLYYRFELERRQRHHSKTKHHETSELSCRPDSDTMRFLAVSIVFLVLTPSSSWRWSWNGAALKVGGCRRRSCHHSQSKCPSSRGAALLKAGNLSSSYRIGTEKRDATVAPLSRSRSISSVAGATTTSYNPLSLYAQCMAIVVAWISTGTIFYALVNKWPIPQSFFYAVDAGMSIGFCTDVAETKLVSKAFTIVFILLGASVVGGALGLFSKCTVVR